MEIVINIEDCKDILERANKIISCPNQDRYSIEDLIEIINELNSTYDYLEEEFMDYKQNIEENYKVTPIDPYEMFNVCECDFH